MGEIRVKAVRLTGGWRSREGRGEETSPLVSFIKTKSFDLGRYFFTDASVFSSFTVINQR